jgi:hypothetical protein
MTEMELMTDTPAGPRGPRFGPARSVAARAAGIVRRLMGTVLDQIFPPACIACRAATARPDALCAGCWSRMRFIERPFCDRLGTPFVADLGAEGLLSPEAIANPPVYARARAVARFEDGPACTG